MAILPPAQIMSLLVQAGMPTDQVKTMAAVCLAESGGDTNARNPADKGKTQANGYVARGLYQIYTNVPESKASHFYDPVWNTEHAVSMYKARGYEPWQAYTNGAYKSHLSQVADITMNPTSSGGTSVLDAVKQGISSPFSNPISSAIGGVVKDVAMPVGVFVLGMMLLVFGVWILVKDTQAYHTAMSKAKQVGKDAAIVSVV